MFYWANSSHKKLLFWKIILKKSSTHRKRPWKFLCKMFRLLEVRRRWISLDMYHLYCPTIEVLAQLDSFFGCKLCHCTFSNYCPIKSWLNKNRFIKKNCRFEQKKLSKPDLENRLVYTFIERILILLNSTHSHIMECFVFRIDFCEAYIFEIPSKMS